MDLNIKIGSGPGSSMVANVSAILKRINRIIFENTALY